MADDQRIAAFLSEAELSPPEKIPNLVQPPVLDFDSQLPSNADAARSLLVQQRRSEPGYRPPEKQTRNKFRLPARREAKCNTDKWTFNKHEVAKAFNAILYRETLESPGVAQALLSHVSVSSLDELWCHFQDSKLERRMSSRLRRSRSSVVPENPWLDQVTNQENLEYMRLMCQAGLGQEVLDRALSITLSKQLIDATETLLGFGAMASACHYATIVERVRLDDIALTKLLLSAPKAMSVEAWRTCLLPEVETLQGKERPFSTILLLCLAHCPDIVCGDLLLKALQAQNFQATAIILAYTGSSTEFADICPQACEFASRVVENEQRHKFFSILAKSGIVVDSAVVRQELTKDVKIRQLPLVQLLTDAEVSLDIEPDHAVRWAVTQMDLDMLELFKNGKFSLPVSQVLDFVPDSASEPDMLRLVGIFAPRGLIGESLDMYLVRAVQKKHIQLVETLCVKGASVEFRQASAIQIALEMADFDILNLLLRNKCSPEILSVTIPTAMALQPRSMRSQAIKALVGKGVQKQELGIPLQKLVSEGGDVDSELIRLLLQNEAPVDGVGNEAENSVFVAARRGNLSVLRMLCNAGPRKETLSEAVSIAFAVIDTHGYDVALAMIELLLQKGAAGVVIHQTLLKAAEQDHQMRILCLLVANGADVNYKAGASFAIALKKENLRLLGILCAGGPPSQASIESVLSTAVDPQYYNMQALELLLGSTPSASAAALNASWASGNFRGNPNIVAIIPCFLRYGLKVDHGDGVLLSFAIEEENLILLTRMLSANPSIKSLTTGFQAAINQKSLKVQRQTMKLLLEKAESNEIGQSKALLAETYVALKGDYVGLKLLLRHKADVDAAGGAVVGIAAAAGSFEVLDILLPYRPSPFTLNRACLAVGSSPISLEQKPSVFERLLAANGGMLAGNMSILLADSVASLPKHTHLPQLLLARGAEVKSETLELALRIASRELFVALANSIESANTLVSIFRSARKVGMASERKYWIYQYLLERGVPSDDVSEALLESLEANSSDLTFPKLLLRHGAAVNYRKGAAFTLALRASSLDAIRLLSQYLDDDSADVAFDLARKTALLNPHIRLEVYGSLLQWRVSESSTSCALVDSLEGGKPDLSIVQLLLAKGADPNKNEARCFVLASRAGAEAEFRVLSKYAKLGLVVKALISTFDEEWRVVWWINVCIEEQSYPAALHQDDLLFQCLRKFPQGTELLKLLLDNGVSPSAKIDHRLCPGLKLETCTALVWSLFSWPRIENNVILVLLSRGRDAALPAYSTPISKVSAGFGCLLDKTRSPVLKALLDLDRDQVLGYTVPGSSFGHMGAYPNKDPGDISMELSLTTASLYLGNFDAFRLLDGGENPDDGTLHSAALLALPEFVNWLLEFHDPNCKIEDFEQMIPLALVCTSKPNPWCKVANEQSDFSARRKETMRILARKTNRKWQYRCKTVLHIALENGSEVTEAMIEALDIRNDPERNDAYLYKDKDGMEYSPSQWLKKLSNIEESDKAPLLACLARANMESRFFKRIAPTKGDQPLGYHGLPPELDLSWKVHKGTEIRSPMSRTNSTYTFATKY